MPELPEVEIARRGLAPYVEGRRVADVILRRPDLRWPVPREIRETLPGQRIAAVRRRAKYLLLDTAAGSVVLHLGMSGSLRLVPAATPARAHDHVDFVLQGQRGEPRRALRLTDPRRFGCVLWQAPGTTHPLLRGLGPEPLEPAFDGDYLFERSRGRKAPVKTFLMDQKVVVGVGNIYATEALFEAGISPLRAAGRVSRERYAALARAVRQVLRKAIRRGGTTLRDFIRPNGEPGFFEPELAVYGRGGQPCPRCGRPLRQLAIDQRATVWCGHCQK